MTKKKDIHSFAGGMPTLIKRIRNNDPTLASIALHREQMLCRDV